MNTLDSRHPGQAKVTVSSKDPENEPPDELVKIANWVEETPGRWAIKELLQTENEELKDIENNIAALRIVGAQQDTDESSVDVDQLDVDACLSEYDLDSASDKSPLVGSIRAVAPTFQPRSLGLDMEGQYHAPVSPCSLSLDLASSNTDFFSDCRLSPSSEAYSVSPVLSSGFASASGPSSQDYFAMSPLSTASASNSNSNSNSNGNSNGSTSTQYRNSGMTEELSPYQYSSFKARNTPPPQQQFSSPHQDEAHVSADGNVYQVRFKRASRHFLLHPGAPLNITVGDFVRVEGDRGDDLGIVQSKVPQRDFREGQPRTAGFRGRGFSSDRGHYKWIYRVATTTERLQIRDKALDEVRLLHNATHTPVAIV